jgi:uncharacterized protein YgfB (UPF0149 family)
MKKMKLISKMKLDDDERKKIVDELYYKIIEYVISVDTNN